MGQGIAVNGKNAYVTGRARGGFSQMTASQHLGRSRQHMVGGLKMLSSRRSRRLAHWSPLSCQAAARFRWGLLPLPLRRSSMPV